MARTAGVLARGPPHRPVTAGLVEAGAIVGAEDVIKEGETACTALLIVSGVDENVSPAIDSGVQVGGILNWVAVESCREGPRGLFQAPE